MYIYSHLIVESRIGSLYCHFFTDWSQLRIMASLGMAKAFKPLFVVSVVVISFTKFAVATRYYLIFSQYTNSPMEIIIFNLLPVHPAARFWCSIAKTLSLYLKNITNHLRSTSDCNF